MNLFEKLENMDHEEVVFCRDRETGLRAIIAVHDTSLGPALGGCRMWNYQSEKEALFDVLRLSRAMTYKAAVAGLDLGGGKAVIIGDPKIKSEALFRAFGRFVESLGGRYITAEDVNIRVEDINAMALETSYVTGASSKDGSGDPSPITSLGVYHGIRASVLHKLGKQDLEGLKIAIQGCGAVGTFLAELLHKNNCKLFVSDVDPQKTENAAKCYGAKIVDVNEIHSIPVDVFAPCALGGVINDKTIPELKTVIVAGGANNQLLDEDKHSVMLKEKDILYAPDYVINAGGLINVYRDLKGYDEAESRRRTEKIYETLIGIYKSADTEGITTLQASNRLAEERILSARKKRTKK